MQKWKSNMAWFVLVCISTVVSIGGEDDYEKFVAIAGGLALAPLGYMLPPLLHFKLAADDKWEMFFDLCLAFVGFVVSFYVTCFSIYAWIVDS